MKVFNAIYSIITNSTSVMAELPGTTSVQPIRAKKPVNYPVLVFRTTDTVAYDTKSGPATVDKYTIKFIIADKSVSKCVDIHEALRVEIDRYSPSVVEGVFIDGVRFDDAYFSDFSDENDVNELHADYEFRVKRNAEGGPANELPERILAEQLLIEDFSPTSGNTITLSNNPDKIISIVRNETPVINYSVSGQVITFNVDGDFGEFVSPEDVRVVYIKL